MNLLYRGHVTAAAATAQLLLHSSTLVCWRDLFTAVLISIRPIALLLCLLGTRVVYCSNMSSDGLRVCVVRA